VPVLVSGHVGAGGPPGHPSAQTVHPHRRHHLPPSPENGSWDVGPPPRQLPTRRAGSCRPGDASRDGHLRNATRIGSVKCTNSTHDRCTMSVPPNPSGGTVRRRKPLGVPTLRPHRPLWPGRRTTPPLVSHLHSHLTLPRRESLLPRAGAVRPLWWQLCGTSRLVEIRFRLARWSTHPKSGVAAMQSRPSRSLWMVGRWLSLF